MTFTRLPEVRAGEVYSNYNHQFDADVMGLLASGGVCAQHSAWDYCGYVWRTADGRWVEQVWRYHAPIAEVTGDSAAAVIGAVVENFGGD